MPKLRSFQISVIKIASLHQASPHRRLKASHKRCLHVVWEAGDALEYARPATAPPNGECSWNRLAWHKFGHPKNDLGSALNHSQRRADLYGGTQFSDGYQNDLLVLLCRVSGGSLSGFL